MGRATVRAFARRGARIGLLARGEEALAATQREVEELGGQALAVPTDVANPEQVEAAASAIEHRFGPLDVWVSVAMATVFAPFTEMEPREFQRATEVTYLGAVWSTRSALHRMLPRDRGAIVLVGSAMAYRGIPLQSAYCGAKHGIKGFFDSVRSELLHQKSQVTLSMVQLPGLNTPQFEHCASKMPKQPMPVPPIYQPELAADAVLLAAREGRRQVWVGVPTVLTIWGNRISSALVDRYLARSGVKSQLTSEPQPRPRAGNLFEPVAGDPGAHGRFDDQAHVGDPVLWMSEHRAALAGVALAGVAAAGLGLIAGTRSGDGSR